MGAPFVVYAALGCDDRLQSRTFMIASRGFPSCFLFDRLHMMHDNCYYGVEV
jgi:hypothetical protein